MTLSYSQTRRSKWPRVKEIKQVEEMLAQRPAWDECQWCPVVLWFDFRRLGAETCWDYWFWMWAQRSPVFFRTSREDLEQTGLAQRKEEAPNFKSWSHGRVLTGRTPYMFVDWREELRGERKLKRRERHFWQPWEKQVPFIYYLRREEKDGKPCSIWKVEIREIEGDTFR